MAQVLVKSIKSEKPVKQIKSGLDELPEQSQTEILPKDINELKRDKKRLRAGNVQMGINFKGRPEIINNGRKI